MQMARTSINFNAVREISQGSKLRAGSQSHRPELLQTLVARAAKISGQIEYYWLQYSSGPGCPNVRAARGGVRKSNPSRKHSNRSRLAAGGGIAEDGICRPETGPLLRRQTAQSLAPETGFRLCAPGSRGFAGHGAACRKYLQSQRLAGGGSRTRTYEGLASGFTVRPLCRSGHSPFVRRSAGAR